MVPKHHQPSAPRPAAPSPPKASPAASPQAPVRLLITAGPTHEPIDQVRYLGNRSSGRLGIALADHAVSRGWRTTLLLGPTPRTPSDSRVRVERFQTTADLQRLLTGHFPDCDCLVMAAAVADYRPVPAHPDDAAPGGKLRRGEAALTLTLEPTPDLLAACAASKRPDQTVVGFALEPRSRLIASATEKLARKHLDFIVANPLETMDSDSIEATLLCANGPSRLTPGTVSKDEFAPWLLAQIEPGVLARR
ncbi:MAG: phosphopantothenoylcysteine decarboxylase [Phycisphaerales bacterium]